MTYEKIGLENLPNVYLNKVRLSICSEGEPYTTPVAYTVAPNVSLYDYEKDYGSVWFYQKNLSRFLQVAVTFLCAIGSTAKSLVQSVIAGGIFLKSLKNVEDILITTANFAARDFNKGPTDYDGLERFYKSFAFGALDRIELSAQQGSSRPDLYMFAQAYIDVDQLKDAFSANFDYTFDQHYYGPLVAEKILHNGREVTQAQIFYTANDPTPMSFSVQEGFLQGFDFDRVSFGAIHSNEELEFMEGSFHSSRAHSILSSVTLDEVLKINYFDCDDELGTGQLPDDETTTGVVDDDYVPPEEDEPELTDAPAGGGDDGSPPEAVPDPTLEPGM